MAASGATGAPSYSTGTSAARIAVARLRRRIFALAEIARRKLRRPTTVRVRRSIAEVHAPESAAVRVRLGDRDAFHLVRHRGVRVAGHDDVDQPAREPAGDGQDLGVRIAGRQVSGRSTAAQRPPAWAATMTTSAPCARSAVACGRMVSARGATDSPPTLPAMVAVSASSVITPTMPTLRPATSTRVVGRTLVQPGGGPLAVSIRFAARNGNVPPRLAP